MENLSYFIIPVFLIIIFISALKNKVNAYDCFITGAKEGIHTSISILPYLLSMFVAVEVFSASGLIQDIIKTSFIPVELVLQGIFRPISSNASLSFMIRLYEMTGPDSRASFASSILQGGTDTTLYVMTLYFGYIGITKTKYAYKVGLLTDLVCFLICALIFFLL